MAARQEPEHDPRLPARHGSFRAFIGKPIRLAYLRDLQRYADALTGTPASCARPASVVKSLLSFAARMGYTPFNVGAAIRPPRPDDRLAERILEERQALAHLDAIAENPRDHALIRLPYNGGLRVSEAVTLEWRNLVDGVINVRGKWWPDARRAALARDVGGAARLRLADALGDDGVFPMTSWNAWDRVRRAARAAGIEVLVSPHFLRHSHGPHALCRGADLATVRETLGYASLSTTGRTSTRGSRNPAAISRSDQQKKKRGLPLDIACESPMRRFRLCEAR